MGRLFWKVFLGFWLTMLVIAAVAALAVFAAQKTGSDDDDDSLDSQQSEIGIYAGRRATNLVSRQAVVLRYGGEQAVRDMLATPESSRSSRNRPRRFGSKSVRIIDSNGKDIFGRDIPAQSLAKARQRLAGSGRGVQQVVSREGNSFLLFVPRTSKRGPRREPLPWYRQISPESIAAVGLVFSLLFSAMLAWYLARPIKALRRGFDRVAAGDLDTRVAGQIGARRDELADLGTDFDRTINQLQQLIQSQRRLLHDVSHELRSPLARVQAAIGLMQQNPDRSEQMIDRIERESIRLDQLVGEILTLSRLDEDTGHGEVALVDLDDLIADTAADARFEAVDRNIRISVDGSAGAVQGYPVLIQRATENLVRNAVKYTQDNTEVNISLGATDSGMAEIRVRDRGPGIPEEKLASITEPFVRLPAKSSTHQTPAGFGLGLAIARRAVDIHSGVLAFSNHTQGGLIATIALPRNFQSD